MTLSVAALYEAEPDIKAFGCCHEVFGTQRKIAGLVKKWFKVKAPARNDIQLDIAGAIIDYISAQVNFPDIDLRQRLTVSSGYGVAEIHIPESSEHIGKTIQESGLRDKDIIVMTLNRGTAVIANPRPQRQIEAGDRLLCFGRLEWMKDLVPAKTRQRRQPKVLDLPDLPVAEEVLREQDAASVQAESIKND